MRVARRLGTAEGFPLIPMQRSREVPTRFEGTIQVIEILQIRPWPQRWRDMTATEARPATAGRLCRESAVSQDHSAHPSLPVRSRVRVPPPHSPPSRVSQAKGLPCARNDMRAKEKARPRVSRRVPEHEGKRRHQVDEKQLYIFKLSWSRVSAVECAVFVGEAAGAWRVAQDARAWADAVSLLQCNIVAPRRGPG